MSLLAPAGHIDTIFLLFPDDLMVNAAHQWQRKRADHATFFGLFMCEFINYHSVQRFLCVKTDEKKGEISQHGTLAHHNVHLHFRFIPFATISTFCCCCWWNKNPTETFLCSCQDCFFTKPKMKVRISFSFYELCHLHVAVSTTTFHAAASSLLLEYF